MESIDGKIINFPCPFCETIMTDIEHPQIYHCASGMYYEKEILKVQMMCPNISCCMGCNFKPITQEIADIRTSQKK